MSCGGQSIVDKQIQCKPLSCRDLKSLNETSVCLVIHANFLNSMHVIMTKSLSLSGQSVSVVGCGPWCSITIFELIIEMLIKCNKSPIGLKMSIKQDILRKMYPYNCFVMAMYQALLMALVSLSFCALKNWGLKKKV